MNQPYYESTLPRWGVEPFKSLDLVIKPKVTPDFRRKFPLKNRNLVDLQK
ncbi:hypothetical protein [Microcystis aeruginosa]|uniref:Uncharacterized protein n=1 Tax=Microcystis aeruginosa NIES-3787 TaxID=2517782 RepID=A0A6H9G864_MICAE|nr:hypothetical protein [Microcystis aeruginosa]GCL46209.1 hypothetical protein NIES3787_19010 [Microcystis aeruginosa NIES-3787]